MGKDYKHKIKNKICQFGDDMCVREHKLQKYDRYKTRKQNKINLNHISIDVLPDTQTDNTLIEEL